MPICGRPAAVTTGKRRLENKQLLAHDGQVDTRQSGYRNRRAARDLAGIVLYWTDLA